jgi:hypothetical protein
MPALRDIRNIGFLPSHGLLVLATRARDFSYPI